MRTVLRVVIVILSFIIFTVTGVIWLLTNV
jgi:hypothetical protein